MPTTLRLYDYWRSGAAWRCRIALNLKQVAVETVPIALAHAGAQTTPAFRRVNPQALVPALVVGNGEHGAGAGIVLTQSLAIIEWLDETYPNPPLLPGDATARARIRAFALAIACDIHPFQNLRVQNYLRHDLALDRAAIDAWLARWVGGGLAACAELLTGQPSPGRFAFGNTPTLADIVLAPQLYSAARFGIGLDYLPRLGELGQIYAETPAFLTAHPDNQPDARPAP